MGLSDRIAASMAVKRLDDEVLYAQAFQEMEAGVYRAGLWAKAAATSDGGHTMRAAYIALRVQSLRDEQSLNTAEVESQAATAKRWKKVEAKAESEKRAEVTLRLQNQAAEAAQKAWKNTPLSVRKRLILTWALGLFVGALACGGRLWWLLPNASDAQALFLIPGGIIFLVSALACAWVALTQKWR